MAETASLIFLPDSDDVQLGDSRVHLLLLHLQFHSFLDLLHDHIVPHFWGKSEALEHGVDLLRLLGLGRSLHTVKSDVVLHLYFCRVRRKNSVGKVLIHRHFLVDRLGHHHRKVVGLLVLGHHSGLESVELAGDSNIVPKEGESAVEEHGSERDVANRVHLRFVKCHVVLSPAVAITSVHSSSDVPATAAVPWSASSVPGMSVPAYPISPVSVPAPSIITVAVAVAVTVAVAATVAVTVAVAVAV